MKKLIVLLLTLLSTTVSSNETTTQNLLDTNFDNGSWSGTADGRHGSSVIASEHDTYIESSSISVRSDAGLTQDQINNGFTTNHSFEYWHWNEYESNVKSTQTLTGTDGETITQIRNYSSISCGYFNCGSYSVGSDSVVVQSNLQTDYDVSVRYDFTDTSLSTTSHYGVDLRNPTLTITYNSIVLDSTTETFLNDTFKDIEEDIKFDDFKIEDEIKLEDLEPEMLTEEFKMDFVEDEVFEEPSLESFSEEVMLTEEMKEEEPKLEEAFDMEFLPEPEEDKEDSIDQEIVMEEEKEEKTEVASESTNTGTKAKESKADVNVQLSKTMDKIDANIKDIDKNLKVKNLVKINAMLDNSMLLSYQVPFYEQRRIYEDQLDIQDNRILYTKNLGEYQQSDPIFIQQSEINNIRLQKEKLIREIEVLRNG